MGSIWANHLAQGLLICSLTIECFCHNLDKFSCQSEHCNFETAFVRLWCGHTDDFTTPTPFRHRLHRCASRLSLAWPEVYVGPAPRYIHIYTAMDTQSFSMCLLVPEWTRKDHQNQQDTNTTPTHRFRRPISLRWNLSEMVGTWNPVVYRTVLVVVTFSYFTSLRCVSKCNINVHVLLEYMPFSHCTKCAYEFRKRRNHPQRGAN